MQVVVQNLKFHADGGADRSFLAGLGDGRNVGLHENLDATVATRRAPKLGGELEIGVTLAGDDVTAAGGFVAAVFMDGQHAVMNEPAVGGEGVGFGTAPAFGGFTIPQQTPAFGLFLLAEGVVDFTQTDVAETNVQPALVGVVADAMNLKADQTDGGKMINNGGAGFAIEPGFDGIALGDDAQMIPFAGFADGVALGGERLASS